MIYHPDIDTPESRQEGAAHDLLLEKLGEKLAYERAFFRLYENFLRKRAAQTLRSFRGKSYEQRIFENFVAMKATHFELLQKALIGLGGNPEQVVPSDDLTAIARLGIVSVFINPRANMRSILHAVRIVELTGKSTTLYLIRLAYAAGADDLAAQIEEFALENEESLKLFPGRRIRGQKLLALHPES